MLVRVAVVICLGFSLFLAFIAYRGSKEIGGGAAQGALGFFMILVPSTVLVIIVTLLSLLVERWFVKRGSAPVSTSAMLVWLSIATGVAMAWNWFFLLVVWRV